VIVTEGPALTASKTVVDKVASEPRITVRAQTRPVAFRGDESGKLRTVVLAGPDGEHEEAFDGVFVFIGLLPNTDVVADLVTLDDRGFVVTDGMLTTSVPGVFAAGDVRQGSTKQAASAAGEGATAALAIRRYVEPLAGGVPERMLVEAD